MMVVIIIYATGLLVIVSCHMWSQPHMVKLDRLQDELSEYMQEGVDVAAELEAELAKQPPTPETPPCDSPASC